MKSPKFSFSHKTLNATVNQHTAKSVWKDKIKYQLRQQLMFDLIEYRDYNARLDAVCLSICQDIERGEYIPKTPRHYIVEKSRGLCRQMTMSTPRDLIVLQCLTNGLYADIIKSQPTKKAFFQPGQQKFNKDKIHVAKSGYGSLASWKRFQQAILDFSNSHEFVVVTDVANFYDFINLMHLRNIVSSICVVDEPVLDFLIYLLEGMSWRPDFMPRTGIGLPQMEAEAPRVLANAMLFELDRVADMHALGDYARFMDDIDVGVDSIAQAKAAVRDIDLTLQSRQLRLNSSKTKILSVRKGEVLDHFCVKENRFLDYATSYLEAEKASGRLSKATRKALPKVYVQWKGKSNFESGRFLRGNGEKIFKRLMILYSHANLHAPESDLLWLVQHHPGLRDTCFNALMRNSNSTAAFIHLAKIFESGSFVDDAAIVYMANFAVHARLTFTSHLHDVAKDLVDDLVASGQYFKIYSALLIVSRFFKPPELLKTLEVTKKYWAGDQWLGRAVAGLSPLVFRDPVIAPGFVQLCQTTNNHELRHVLDFHVELRSDVKAVNSSYTYAKTPNPSFPFGIFYPKVLISLSIFQNPLATKEQSKLLTAHPSLTDSALYGAWF